MLYKLFRMVQRWAPGPDTTWAHLYPSCGSFFFFKLSDSFAATIMMLGWVLSVCVVCSLKTLRGK